ncbi:MAG TPA: hypothetical protein VFT65_17920 [Candidatus Angelobacter sp.]|nr:hypothetical protein [Candidatus Angelobacter sp.]
MGVNGKKAGNQGSNQSNGHSGNGTAVRPPHFGSKLISAIPHGRKGKHNLIVSMILDDLEALDPEKAVLIPLAGLEGEKMENVRSALNRATRQRSMQVATATDEKFFYVWRTEPGNTRTTAPGRVTSQTTHPR